MSFAWPSTWELVLTSAVFLSTLITLFIITLPTSYVHFHPGHLDADDFSEEDRDDPARSGYVIFKRNADAAGRYATKTTVQVVVLGDIGRSPRMQYHALSLAKHGAGVQLIGYADTEPHPDVLASRFIKILALPSLPSSLQTRSRMLFPIQGPLKALYQAWALYKTLAYHTTASRYMLVQNPPSIPLLAVAVFVCFFRNTRLVIDWHNFGFSILALRLGPSHPLVRLSWWYEAIISGGATAHFTVTDAMRRKVKQDFGITAVTLHDRPAQQFQPTTESQRLQFLRSCDVTKSFADRIIQDDTKLIVSSTSWTADEDFGVLLEALVGYSNQKTKDERLPSLLVVITGKGPQKREYEERIHSLDAAGGLASVDIVLAWLDIQDYASLLAAASLGICLHTSSSGVDLPMKVLDMFGSGLPVAAWNDYESWSELIQENENGLGFKTADSLTCILVDVFTTGSTKLDRLRHGASKEGSRRWDEEWDKVAAKIFRLD